MPIINSYTRDTNIQNSDVFVGTRASNRQTVNFTAQAVADYLNIKGKISISGQSIWQFVTQDPGPGTISFTGGGGNHAPFSGITNLVIAISDASGQNTVAFMNYLVGSQIMLSQQNAISLFGHYSIKSYSVTANPNFYNLELAYIGGNGEITKGLYYDMTCFNLGTQTFIFNQITPSATWVITHNLGRFPSVSVVDTSNRIVFTQAQYTTTNSLTLSFSSAFAGKAYLN